MFLPVATKDPTKTTTLIGFRFCCCCSLHIIVVASFTTIRPTWTCRGWGRGTRVRGWLMVFYFWFRTHIATCNLRHDRQQAYQRYKYNKKMHSSWMSNSFFWIPGNVTSKEKNWSYVVFCNCNKQTETGGRECDCNWSWRVGEWAGSSNFDIGSSASSLEISTRFGFAGRQWSPSILNIQRWWNQPEATIVLPYAWWHCNTSKSTWSLFSW